MVDIFLYAISALLIILLPIFVRVEGAFSFERRLFFVSLRLYGIRILSVIIYFDQEGEIFLSLNGKKAKPIIRKSEERKDKADFLPLLEAIYLNEADLSLYVGGTPQSLSLILGALQIILNDLILSANARSPVEYCRIRVLPCYVNDQISANFSISLFTSPVLILAALMHTKKGVKHAKGSNRKFDGENIIRSQTDD